jgi:hypothetical protein
MILPRIYTLSKILMTHQRIISFDRNRIYATGNYKALIQACSEQGIEWEEMEDQVEIKTRVFLGERLVYFEQLNFFEPEYVLEDFCILKSNGEFCYHSRQTNQLLFSDDVSSAFKINCTNLFYYTKLYNFLASREFCDHHNDADRELIIYNSAKGILKIKYELPSSLQYKQDISEGVKSLLKTGTTLQMRTVFLNTLFEISNNTGLLSMDNLIGQWQEIDSSLKRNYELFSRQFNFEKFKDSLYREKEKYFENIRTIVNKIFSQSIGIPLSVSATIFTTKGIMSDLFMLCIVGTAFLTYIVLYLKIQLTYLEDLILLENDFENDFNVLKRYSGLPVSQIENESNRIKRKINATRKIIRYLIAIVIILTILICIYIPYAWWKNSLLPTKL